MDGSRASDSRHATWTPVCALADIPRLGARVVERAERPAAATSRVFRTADDRVFALADRCPHKGGPLSQGIVHGDRVTCPLHNWNIDLGTGDGSRTGRRLRRALSRCASRTGWCRSRSSPAERSAGTWPRPVRPAATAAWAAAWSSSTTAGASPACAAIPTHPANFGKLCSKGSTLHLTAQPAAQRYRATHPLVRAARGRRCAQAGWDTTLDALADRFAECIRTHGPDSVAFYVSGQLLTEDYYVFNKLAKGLVGTNNIDTNSRLCMSSAVTGYKATLGADAPPACYEDIDHADLIFIAGSNTAWAHPILFRRIEAAKARNPALKIVVVDPRRTATADFADLHLAIEPGTDVALFHGLLHVMLWEGWIDADYIAAHTTGFAALKDAGARVDAGRGRGHLRHSARTTWCSAARWFGEARAVLSLYCQGLNQSSSGTAKNAALINLHLATGQIGRPGAGPFSLTGQPNAMGGREVGGMATLLSGHRDLAERAAPRGGRGAVGRRRRAGHARARRRWRCSTALAAGDVRMIWIACTNPAQSLPDQAAVRADSRRAELVVLQEAYTDTETAAFADVLLPATTWGEKDGTVTNSERRISRVRAAVPGPGEARADWAIAVDFARRLEARLQPAYLARTPTLFPYASPRRRSSASTSRTTRRPRSRHHGPFVRRARDARPAAVAVSGRRRRRAGRGSTPTAYLPTPTAARASRPCRTCRSRRSPTPGIRFVSTPVACAISGTA